MSTLGLSLASSSADPEPIVFVLGLDDILRVVRRVTSATAAQGPTVARHNDRADEPSAAVLANPGLAQRRTFGPGRTSAIASYRTAVEMVVRRARPSEWTAVAETLVDALRDDPFFLWLVGIGFMKDPVAYFRNQVDYLLKHEARIDTTDAHEGIAIWTKPVEPPIHPNTPDMVKVAIREIAAAAPRDRHELLAWIGTRQAAQGSGLGTAVLANGLARMDKRDRPTALWTSSERSRSFFEHHGGYAVITDVKPIAAPKSWWLWRDPK